MMRAFVLVSFAWIGGLALVVLAGLLLGVLVPGPAATIMGPLVLGALLALAQRRVVRRATMGRGFVALTAIGAAAGWLLGSVAGFALFRAGHEALAPWANGAVVGAVVGALQCATLRRAAPRHRIAWTLGSVLAWGAAVGPLLAPGAPPWARLAALAVPGVFGAVAVLWTSANERAASMLALDAT
jgi:hypothetical protein